MKIFPIKVEKSIPMNHKFIEWKIHNVCNHNCSFCPSMHKDGSQRWFTLEKYKSYLDKLSDLSEGKPYWIQFTGGEPTLFPKFIELCEYAKNKNAFISLLSNGVRTLRWWEELRASKTLDSLYITYHSEQTENYFHHCDILNLFLEEETIIIGLVTHVKNSIDLAFKAFEYLLENTGAVITLKAMMIADYDIYELYNKEQLNYILENNWRYGKLYSSKKNSPVSPNLRINHTLNITYNNNTKFKIDPQFLMKMRKNRFQNWECEIGKNNMRIDYDVIYRGVCEVGETRHLDDFNLNFTNDYVTCTKIECFCDTDMIATKYLPEHLYPK